VRLREWQTECLDAFIEARQAHGQDLFVFEACPGAGKSHMAAEIAWQMLNDPGQPIHFVLVIVPWKSIQGDVSGGMVGTFDKRGLKVRDRLMLRGARIVQQPVPVNLDAVVTTYAEAMTPEAVDTLKMWAAKGLRIAVVFDEIHHANEVNGTWGTYAEQVEELSLMTVVMSGTFFRSDGSPIKFVKYDDDRKPVLSCPAYTYTRGVSDRVVRPVSFRFTDAEVTTVDEDKGVETRNLFGFSASDKRLGKVMREVFDPNGDCVRTMIHDVDQQLMATRRRFANAGALICCRPGRNDASEDKHVHGVAKKVRQYTGQDVVVVTHTDRNAQGKIDAFRNGIAPYLVAVDMVSEGVDIPRLRAVAMLRVIRSEMMFRQLVGRCVRMTEDEDGTAAMVFLPKFVQMHDFAMNMELESLQGIRDLECNTCGQYPCICLPLDDGNANGEPSVNEFDVLSASPFEGGGAYSKDHVAQAMLVIARAVMQKSPIHAHANDVQLAHALECAAPMMLSESVAQTAETTTTHLQSLISARSRVNRLMQKLAGKKYAGDFKKCWGVELMKPFNTDWQTAKNTWKVSELESFANRLQEKLVEAFTNENV